MSNSPRKSEEDSARRTPWSEGGNACQDLRRQLDKLQEARRQEDKEDKKEAMKQQKKGVASSSRQEAAEETEVKLPDSKGSRTRQEETLSKSIMAGEGEKLSDTHLNTEKFYAEEKDGQLYVAREQNVTLLKVARVGGN